MKTYIAPFAAVVISLIGPVALAQQSPPPRPAAAVASDAARNLNLNHFANTTHGAASTGPAVSTAVETMVPLSAFARFEQGAAPLSVPHQGAFVASILSTLPSAGVGAFLALMVCRIEFSIIAFIGVLLDIGIVKKNAIMMIDFALHAERIGGLSPRDAVQRGGLSRFRPIMMTTVATLFGASPLALGTGDGGELRQPLGVSIIGGSSSARR